MSIVHLLTFLAFFSFSLAAVVPTGPGPNDVFAAGGFCTIDWKIDTTMTWTNMTVDLMSGSNDNMTWVATVAQGMDGTDPSLVPYNWTCPDVDPYGPIYFYQFTQYTVAETQWTARFAITSSTGEQAPAAQSNQPSGAQIPWGNGVLRASSVDSKPAQPYSWDAPDSLDGSSAQNSSAVHDEQPVPSKSDGRMSNTTHLHNSTVAPTRSRRPRPRPSSAMPIAAPTLDAPSSVDDPDADDLYTNDALLATRSFVLPLLLTLAVTIMLFGL